MNLIFARVPMLLVALSTAVMLTGGCAPPSSYAKKTKVTILDNGEPSHITVQHCLIGFQGSVSGKSIKRSRAEAELLAHQILEKAQAGEDFYELVKQHTDDSPPGIYDMANDGFAGDRGRQLFARREMVPAFGNTGFPLEVGEYGLAEHHPTDSPFGWHIVKRVK